MRNIIITEKQLSRVLHNIQEGSELSSIEAMRKIVSVLKKNGYNDEEIVDLIIKLRQKDVLSYMMAKKIKDEPVYDMSVEKMYKNY